MQFSDRNRTPSLSMYSTLARIAEVLVLEHENLAITVVLTKIFTLERHATYKEGGGSKFVVCLRCLHGRLGQKNYLLQQN